MHTYAYVRCYIRVTISIYIRTCTHVTLHQHCEAYIGTYVYIHIELHSDCHTCIFMYIYIYMRSCVYRIAIHPHYHAYIGAFVYIHRVAATLRYIYPYVRIHATHHINITLRIYIRTYALRHILHTSPARCDALGSCFWELIRQGVLPKPAHKFNRCRF